MFVEDSFPLLFKSLAVYTKSQENKSQQESLDKKISRKKRLHIIETRSKLRGIVLTLFAEWFAE